MENGAVIKANISILVVSKESFYNVFKVSILQVVKETPRMKYNLKLHNTESVRDFFQQTPKVQVDFVVFIIDPRIAQSLLEVEENFKHLDEICKFGRTCLIKIDFEVMHHYDHCTNETFALCKKYGLHLIVDSLMNPAKCCHLSKRVLNLVTSACGSKTGLPPYMGYKGRQT